MNNHDWISYDKHVELMHKFVDQSFYMLDTSAPQQEFHKFGCVPANELLSAGSHQNDFDLDFIFYAVFVIASPVAESARIKLYIRKLLDIEHSSHGLRSKTRAYSYHMQWSGEHKNVISDRSIRFDNEDPNYGHATDNHFHCELRYRNPQKNDIIPAPAHVGNGFPYLSDVLEFSYKLLSLNFNTAHFQAARVLQKLSAKDKQYPPVWVPIIGPMSELLTFLS